MQHDIIDCILQNKSVLALLPTGGGKSICYQVPALMKDGFCLVISPLVALMQDQVSRLKSLGIPAAAIHAGMHYNDVKRTFDNAINDAYKLLYVSPERLQSDLFKEYLPEFNITLLAIDEAHCISQWGHDFRPDYLKIASVLPVLNGVPVLMLTASATTDVQQDIIQQLQLENVQLFRQTFDRQNLFYDVCYTENKNNDLLQFLSPSETSIIYCRSRRQTEVLNKYLSQHGINSLVYHAGIPKDKREDTQKAWMHNEVRIMIATTAFGMGIDKPEVRAVIHYDAPEHLEAWYQEAGRAGRDGKPAQAITLYNATDTNRLADSTSLQFPPEAYLKHVYQSVVEYLQVPISAQPDQYYPFDLYDFCKKFNLQATQASYALKLLEREGLWTLSDAVFNPATIQFTATRGELDQLAKTYPDLGYIATGILRLYGTVFSYPTAVRLFAIAKQLKMDVQLVEQLVLKLQEMDILEYRKPLSSDQLFFHHYRVDSKHLLLDMKRILLLRERHEARTKAMVSFLENRQVCRSKIFLGYFGEDVKHDCGHCDVCRSGSSTSLTNEKELRKTILQHLNNKPVSFVELSTNFPAAIKAELTALIRVMADEGNIRLYPNGTIALL